MWSYRHQNFTVHQLPALRDNYIYLIESHTTNILIAVDPAVAVSVRNACKKLNKKLSHIINTHHHWDHTDGNLELKSDFGCQIIGFEGDAPRIPGIDIKTSEAFSPDIPELNITVLEVPGHTSGHIAYLIDDALFCGDTLFGAGCGRLFEGTASQMWQSLNKFSALPDQTRVYCAHEYTLANLEFARHIDADNKQLERRIELDKLKRNANEPTIPSTVGLEKLTNPFLRPSHQNFCSSYATQNNIENDAVAVFTDIRLKKDHF
ncbi:hydroxyacylglutathione hydrolase [Mariprofundus micogutta]|uniref:Hydroxyacylglutathione hydrolase n=1 Tax=Mariprofundus micogutta TaxID=1921010 RepID=A0A1L8CNW8_9PROT|nr:hydroxyacylglutathione hydrolase [Mariprofundus micogutta]GAV20598.1 hydroxyacylglutathione hydrolase [Mariprofundus micogutta]